MFKKLIALTVSSLLLLAPVWPAARPALAAPAAPADSTFTVNSFLDQVDDNVADWNCHTLSGTCTLRAAIMQADALSSPITITVPAGTYILTLGSLNPSGNPAVISLVGAGAASTIINGNQLDRVLSVAASATAIVRGLTLTGGLISAAFGEGGGIDNFGTLTLDHSTLSGNQAPLGIGGGVTNNGTLTVVDSTIGPNNAAVRGGGLWNMGTLTVERSTVSGNGASFGGGLFTYVLPASLTLINSTVSQNSSVDDGGGLYNYGLTNIYNTTIAFNLADANHTGAGTGGGVFNDPSGQVNLRNTLLAGNGVGTLATHADCTGTLYVYGLNRVAVAGDASPCPLNSTNGNWSNLNSLDQLGLLQDNGGPSWTHALLPGSNAIDGGEPAGCLGPDYQTLPTDQRGQPRTVGLACDIGAFEFAPLVAGAPMTVDSPLDQIDADTRDGVCRTASNTCTLRAAIMQADHLPDTISGVTITVPAGLYQLSLPRNLADDAASGDLNLTAGLATINLVGAGADSTIIDAHGINDRVLSVAAGRVASLSGLTLRGGSLADAPGGAIFNLGTLTLDQDTITDNHVKSIGIYTVFGGGVANGGALTVNSSVIFSNTAFGGGGGIANTGGTLTVTNSTLFDNHVDPGNSGGGIFSAGSTTLINSTLHDNSAGYGGGIGNSSLASLFLINSTLSGNRSANHGGGLYNHGTANIYNTTIAFNLADSGDVLAGLGGGVFDFGTTNLRNSLVAGNGVGVIGAHDDCHGTLYSYGQNLIAVAGDNLLCTVTIADTGSFGYLNSLDLLGPLQDNGGPTLTHALLAGSNAIDAGDPTQGCIGPDSVVLPTDQRGIARALGLACDIGAFEALPPVIYLPFTAR